MVTVFDDLWRVLRKDGVAYLNYGDPYSNKSQGHYKPKDLMGLSWDLAKALQRPHFSCPECGHQSHADTWGRWPDGRAICPACLQTVDALIARKGWWVRNAVVWRKPSGAPQSAADRFSTSYEHVFMLAKARYYFFDAEAVRTPLKDSSIERYGRNRRRAYEAPGQDEHRGLLGAWEPNIITPGSWANAENYHDQDPRYPKREKKRGHERRHDGFADKWDKMTKAEQQANGARLRDVWTIAGAGLKEAHFAAFPVKLVEICLKAGTPEIGVCASCGTPWKRIIKKTFKIQDDVSPEKAKRPPSDDRRDGGYVRGKTDVQTLGWQPACKCKDTARRPAVVLDPFGGSGTVGAVAEKLNRDSILIELHPEYVNMSRVRVGLFCEISRKPCQTQKKPHRRRRSGQEPTKPTLTC